MKQYLILTDKPIRTDQAFQTEGGLWAVCSLPAENEHHALNITKGCTYWAGGITEAVEGDFVWQNGHVVGLNLKKKV